VSEPSAFERRSIAVATGFLQSAVILDDQAYLEEEPKEAITKLPPPSPYAGAESHEEELPSSVVASATQGNNPVPTKTLVHAFARYGIICAVLDPEEDSELWLSLHPDITILDWYIRDETGERARSLLRQLIEHERNSVPHQVRLMLVYTTEQDLLDIREKLSQLLKGIDNDVTSLEFGATGLMWGGWHFIVLAKPGTDVAENLSECEIDYEDLPERAVEGFARAVGGLLPNVAIEGLAAVRRNTHRLLQRFSSGLDPAYLTHRALLPNPADSEEHLIGFLGSELTAILEDEGVGSVSRAAAVEDWVSQQGIEFPLKIKCDDLQLVIQDFSRMSSLLADGIASHPLVSGLPDNDHKRLELVDKCRLKLTRLLGGKHKTDDARFAELTTFRPHYGAIAPKLTLGSILRDESNDKYWLCIQPKCDSIRLKEKRAFPFLPLTKGQHFDICKVYDDGQRLKLLRERKPHGIRTYTFWPDETGVVRAALEGKSFVFTTTSRKMLQWIGQLRDSVAQDVAHKIGTSLSRVGVNPSEWQRLSLPRHLRET